MLIAGTSARFGGAKPSQVLAGRLIAVKAARWARLGGATAESLAFHSGLSGECLLVGAWGLRANWYLYTTQWTLDQVLRRGLA